MSVARSAFITRRQVLLAGAAPFMAGCGGIQLLPTPMQPQLYVLRPDIMPPAGNPVRWRLTVGTPDASASLDTERIALSRTATTMDYFANAAWTDRVPAMIQRLLLQTFDASNRIVAVSRDTNGIENDYLLETEIRDFEARYDMPEAAPQVIVTIQARLARMPQREIIAGVNVRQQAQATANVLDAIVLAFNQATAAAVSQVTNWTLNAPQPAPA
jgi:cholesterol transport system auxiliary component